MNVAEDIGEEIEALVGGMIVMAICLVMICCFVALTVQDERQDQYERQQLIEEQLTGKGHEAVSESKWKGTVSSKDELMQTAQLRSLTRAEVP